MMTAPEGSILFVDKSRYWAGAEQSLAELVRGVGSKGPEVKIVVDFPQRHHGRYNSLDCLVGGRYDTTPSWAPEAWRNPPRGLDRLFLILSARRLHSMVRQVICPIVHINLLRSRSIHDVRAASRAGAVVVGHVRMLEGQAFPSRRVLEACDGVIGISHAVTNAITHHAPDACAVTIHDLVDTEYYCPVGDRVTARERLGLPPDKLVIVSPHSLIHRKGHDIAIRVLAAMGTDAENTVLVIAGGLPGRFDSQNAVTIEELSELAASEGVGDRVLFVGDVQDMRTLYTASDVVLALSRDGEAFGRIAVEAGLMERPVIATNLGATPELVVDGETGLLVPPDNVAVTGQALRRLLREPATRERLGRAARAHLEPRVSRDKVAGQVMRFYGEALAARQKLR